MKNKGRKNGVLIAIFALVLAADFVAQAQTGSPIDLSSYPLVASNAIPAFGNFYLVNNYGVTPLPGLDAFGPPLPGDPRPDLPVYYLGSGNYMIDNSNDPNANEGSMAMSRGGMMMGSGEMLATFTFPREGLWLEITGVTNDVAFLNLHNATNQVYEILSKTDLSQPAWTIENEVWPTNATVMPFTIPEYGRTNLFVWAMDWTGVTENSNATPDWWFWEYFGTTGLSDNTLDFRGNTLLNDYQNGLDPNLINFSLAVTNQFVRTSQTTATLAVSQGQVFQEAVLIDDTNLSDADWTPYTNASVTVNFGGLQGWHSVWIGLTGHATNSTPAWQSIRLKYDPTPPVLIITNPVPGTVIEPMIELQGYSSKPLTAISYDLSNAAGSVTNQQVLVLDEYYDTNTFEYTTSTFQGFDIPVTNGLNAITLHATDLAGNTTTASYNYTLDYSTKTNPPLVKLYWPQNQTMICISNYTWRGWVDDPTATVVAQMTDTVGDTNIYDAEVGRDGNFWVENMTLADGTNYLSLTVTDAAGNVTTTNITVDSGSLSLNINAPSTNQVWSNAIPVTGTISDSTDYTVWVNGVKATLNGDGTWTANGVPLPPGGTTVMQARAIPNSDNGGNGTGGNGGGPVTYANLGNPASTQAQDTDTQNDKPSRLYVSYYTLNETGYEMGSDYYMDADSNPVIPSWFWSTWDWYKDTGTTIGNWRDGIGGSANWTRQQMSSNMVSTLVNNDSNNVTYQSTAYPDVEIATQNDSDDDFNGENPMPIFWESCNISTPLFDQTGSALVPPEYNDGETFDFQTLKDTETRRAQATISLFTGGKGVPGNYNLFVLTATAGSMTFCKDPPPTQLNYSCIPWSPILPTSIKMGELPYLGSDGNLFVALPDNVTKIVTPTVSGNPYYTFSASASKHRLIVTANQAPLFRNKVYSYANYCVGQELVFAPAWVPALDGIQIQNKVVNWAFAGDFVNYLWQNYGSVGTPIGSVNYSFLPSALADEITTNWWVSGGFSTPNTYSATVGMILTFANGQQADVTGRGLLNMYRPRAYMVNPAVHGTPANIWITPWNSLHFGRIGLGLPGGPNNMSYELKVLSPAFLGYAQITQLCTINASGNINVSNYLDNQDPYPDTGGRVTAGSQLNTLFLDDAPNNGGFSSFYCTASFVDYIMFSPETPGSIFVPLGHLTWGTSFAASYSSAAISPNTVTSTNDPDDSEAFPMWIYVYSNSNN